MFSAAAACYVVSLGTMVALHVYGVFPLEWIADHISQLAITAIVMCDIASVGLYLWSFRQNSDGSSPLLALAGNSGVAVYDFFIGRELNPRIQLPFLPPVDLKFFNELRPGLQGWVLINLAFLAKHIALVKEAGRSDETLFGLGVTNEMLLVQLFQAYYVLDSALCERSILTTMDITTDGFGLMLCFGDLAWLPFTYSLQAAYLSQSPQYFGPVVMGIILAVSCTGLFIFRSSNSEKDQFRRDPTHPSVAHLTSIPTARKTRLITSGWWGTARHINYFGDWLMALAWCLCTGFTYPITYFYAGYFAVLLIHRERRDDHACHLKYGQAWEEYRKLVPWRIVPFVY